MLHYLNIRTQCVPVGMKAAAGTPFFFGGKKKKVLVIGDVHLKTLDD